MLRCNKCGWATLNDSLDNVNCPISGCEGFYSNENRNLYNVNFPISGLDCGGRIVDDVIAAPPYPELMPCKDCKKDCPSHSARCDDCYRKMIMKEFKYQRVEILQINDDESIKNIEELSEKIYFVIGYLLVSANRKDLEIDLNEILKNPISVLEECAKYIRDNRND